MQDDPSGRRMTETLDLLSEVVANVSARVDDQTQALEALRKTSTETRQAAFAARANTDPKRYGDIIGETVEGELDESFQRLATAATTLQAQSVALTHQIETRTADRAKADREFTRRRVDLLHREAALPRKLIICGVATLLLTIIAMRLALGTTIGCTLLAADWNRFGPYCVVEPIGEW